MKIRFISTWLLALAALSAATAGPRAQAVDRGTGYSSFGASPIPRQTVSFPDKYGPGTIVVNTTERRLYYVLGTGQ
ncbi:MAG: L,D-transpeptidase, partial [Rhodoplanes sp.]